MPIRQWKPKPLRITPVETLEQYRASAYVCTAGFDSVEAADRMDLRKVTLRRQHPLRDGHLSRIGWWGERVVGHVGVVRHTLQLGRARLPFAGIAGVCADPRARKHGIASALLRDVLEASRQAGLSFSVLFGIRDFYHRFGFVPAWATHRMTVAADQLPGLPRWRGRAARRADVDRMMAVRGPVYDGIDGMAVREPQIFLRRPKREPHVVLTGAGRQDWAYVVWRMIKVEGAEQLEIIETAGSGTDWPRAVLAWTGRHAAKRDKDKLIFRLPEQHPVCRQLRFGDAQGQREYLRNSGAMAAVLDFAGLSRTMAPEWQVRLDAAGLRVPREGLAVRFRDEFYRWWPGRADCAAERLPKSPGRFDAQFNDGLARLVLGHGRPEDTLAHHAMRVGEAALPIVRAIFCERELAYSALDYF